MAWDNKWFCEVTNLSDRWIVEIAIPFKTLRFDKEKDQWGINFFRRDAGSNSIHTWAPVPIEFNEEDLGYLGVLSWNEPPAKASRNLGLNAHATFSGALLWHNMYPWPQRPEGLVETGFRELADRWVPILNAFDEAGVDLCYEIHPGEDLHDGVTFERFLEATDNHPRCHILYDPSHFLLQQLDYVQFIDFYHERIKMFHVKDAEFNPSGRAGVYGGYQDWKDRPGRFRSLGDGQVDFSRIFSQFARYEYSGWAVLEWECCLKHPEDGAREGVDFIERHMIRTTDRAFDDFAGSGTDEAANRRMLGID